MTTTTDNRRFHRIAFDGVAWLSCGTREAPCTLADISLRGALVMADEVFECATVCTLRIPLAADVVITMEVKIVRTMPETRHMALECLHIDIDSIRELRRLVELNLGDEALLHRDLAALYEIGGS